MKSNRKAVPACQLSISWAPEPLEPAPPAADPVMRVTSVMFAPELPAPVPAAPAGLSPEAESYLLWCEGAAFSPRTRRNSRVELVRAEREIHKPMLAITTADVEAFLLAMSRRVVRGHLIRTNTVLKTLDVLASWCHWAVWHDVRPDDPTARIRRPRPDKRLRKAVPAADVEKLLAYLAALGTMKGIRDYAAIAVAYFTGARASEIVGLDVCDVLGPEIRLWGKGRKERTVPICEQLRAILDAVLAIHPTGHGPLFLVVDHHMHSGKRISYDGLRFNFNQACLIAGIARYTLHQLRHAFATRLLNAGVRIDVIQGLLGHESIATTQLYAHSERPAGLVNALGAAL